MLRQIARASGYCWRRNRDFHTLYLHRTVTEADDRAARAVRVGLLGVLRVLERDVGYFRPVGAANADAVKGFDTMWGIDRRKALEFLANGDLDEMLEQIYVAYRELKRRHECVLIEGTQFCRDASALDAHIASALGSPVLLATNVDALRQLWSSKDHAENLQDWATEIATYTRCSALAFEKLKVRVVGGFVYGSSDAPDMRKVFSKWKLQFVGALPGFDERENPVAFADNIEIEALKRNMPEENAAPVSPLLFRNSLFSRAKENNQVILLPEGDEPRTVQAAGFILQHGLCSLILLGEREKLLEAAKVYNVDLRSAIIKDPSDPQELEKYATVYYQTRKHKGMTLEKAREILGNDPITLGTCMVSAGDADGMVCGAVHTTANTVRPALQIIKTDPATPIVSSVMFICLEDAVVAYADVAINASPSADELATIAIASADTVTAFGLEPRVALLSYATGDSNAGPLVQKVADAASIARSRRPDLLLEGPFQYDAAVNAAAAKIKLKGKNSEVAGKANVFIFPDLNSSNIACKVVQQHTGATVIGPILQGLRKPVNDLSRGCTVKDIIATIATTAIQAAAEKKKSKAVAVEAMKARKE
ncbi:uncharacterized protein LOC9660299 isoform X2 [Selaginella moellendorffii]|uniref:uncharacterized protein LOC9660299 isoform X2 n=1 Tax=Selaginella moellendorffii TaxID=88036 RepID=UPI000D1D0764|nr:uncharacterized protein LOC9660299 isoform X2 [Selaginella moellendorffii]|eukprot:XP_024530181.1 uncharacterized protein LOC9660299 isoform X2 [Selaginella moellendorffii]